MFLLKKVETKANWDHVYSEAKRRLKGGHQHAIFDLVFHTKEEAVDKGQHIVRIGENSYYSGLYISSNNTLQKVDPDITVESLRPIWYKFLCANQPYKETLTLNGERFCGTNETKEVLRERYLASCGYK